MQSSNTFPGASKLGWQGLFRYCSLSLEFSIIPHWRGPQPFQCSNDISYFLSPSMLSLCPKASLNYINLIHYYWKLGSVSLCTEAQNVSIFHIQLVESNYYQSSGLVLLTPQAWLEVACHWELCEFVRGRFVWLAGCRSVFAGRSRWRCNLVSQCVGAGDLWPPCLSLELPFDCFIPSRALESMLMSKVLIYQSIRG